MKAARPPHPSCPASNSAARRERAQVISLNQGRARGQASADLKNNAWFVGFAPRRNPEIVVAVLVQGGELRRGVRRADRARHREGLLR